MVKNKKAQAHIEMILSFALFIGALVFIMMFLNPFAQVKGEVSNTAKIYDIVKEDLSAEIGKLSIIIPPPQKDIDGNLIPPPETPCPGVSPGMSIPAINELISDYGNFHVINKEENKYIVYFSDDTYVFSGENDIFSPTENGECIPGVYSKEKIFVKNKITKFVTEYQKNYETLKSSLGVSDDFLLIFIDKSGGEIDELNVKETFRKTPQGVNVASENFPIRMIDEDGNIRELILNVRGW